MHLRRNITGLKVKVEHHISEDFLYLALKKQRQAEMLLGCRAVST